MPNTVTVSVLVSSIWGAQESSWQLKIFFFFTTPFLGNKLYMFAFIWSGSDFTCFSLFIDPLCFFFFFFWIANSLYFASFSIKILIFTLVYQNSLYIKILTFYFMIFFPFCLSLVSTLLMAFSLICRILKILLHKFYLLFFFKYKSLYD